MAFKRKYRLTIGEPGGIGTVFTELDFKFTIIKSVDSKLNKATFVIWNMSKNTRETITDKSVVLFEAGYEDDAELVTIYQGDITQFSNRRSDGIIQTTLHCLDGYTPLKEGHVSKQYTAGQTYGDIINDIVQEFLGLPQITRYSSEDTPGVDTVLSAPRTLFGQAETLLDQLTTEIDSDWQIRDNFTFIVLPKDGTTTTESAYKLSPTTGLIGSPERSLYTKNDKGANKFKETIGWKVQSLLNGRINPGNPIVVDSQDLQATLKVSQVKHTGHYEGNDWTTTIEAVDPSTGVENG